MASENFKRVKRAIRKDSKLKRFQELYENAPQYNLPIKDFQREIEVSFTARKMRELKGQTRDMGFAQNIIDSLMEDQAIRGRYTEILTACVRCDKSLANSLDKLRDYILLEYHTNLVSLYSTKGERERFVTNLLRPYEDYRKAVNCLKDELNLMVVDIDKAGFAVKNTIEAIKLLSRPEAQL